MARHAMQAPNMQPLIGDSWHLAQLHSLTPKFKHDAFSFRPLHCCGFGYQTWQQKCKLAFRPGRLAKNLLLLCPSMSFGERVQLLSSTGSEQHDSKSWNICL